MKNTSESLMPIAGLDSSGNPVYTNRSKKVEADANLIASAPEMKKALEMVRDAWENNEINFECDERNGTGYVGTHHLIKNTLDALAKAEGSE